MKKTLELLAKGFESSSGKTPEFANFTKIFKTELKKELQAIGATLEVFSIGHFYVSGFFKLGEKLFYFSLSDVRGSEFSNQVNLLFRTAEHLKDWTGGHNQYVTIQPEEGETARRMNLNR